MPRSAPGSPIAASATLRRAREGPMDLGPLTPCRAMNPLPSRPLQQVTVSSNTAGHHLLLSLFMAALAGAETLRVLVLEIDQRSTAHPKTGISEPFRLLRRLAPRLAVPRGFPDSISGRRPSWRNIKSLRVWSGLGSGRKKTPKPFPIPSPSPFPCLSRDPKSSPSGQSLPPACPCRVTSNKSGPK